MKSLRIAAVIAIAALAVAGLRSCVVIPLHCQRLVKKAEDRTRDALTALPERRAIMARENIRNLRRCERRYPPDINVYMLLGANYQIVEEWESAAQSYERALDIDRRPEIYLNLGLTQMELGQPSRAIDSFVVACSFAPHMLEELPEGGIREAVIKRIEAQYGPDWLR